MTFHDQVISNLPRKKNYRQRAHSNPIADHYFDNPNNPDEMDWSQYYPLYFKKNFLNENNLKEVEFLDIGCGYGGLLFKLAKLYPNRLSLGLEIRVKVSEYVIQKIKILRNFENSYENIACIRTNAMKFLPNYFRKGQIKKMFFLFPDPHFKNQKHKWRIISQQLLGEYAYILKESGRVYFITDVIELYEYMKFHFDKHPLFVKVDISEQELQEDIVIPHIFNSSEEGQKVERDKREKFWGIYKRINFIDK